MYKLENDEYKLRIQKTLKPNIQKLLRSSLSKLLNEDLGNEILLKSTRKKL